MMTGETRRRPDVRFLYPAIFVYSTVLFSTYTPQGILVISLMRQKVCGQADSFDDDDGVNCDEDEVSSQAAVMSMWIGLAQAVPSILVAGEMGALANRYGRRLPPILVLSGAVARCVLVRRSINRAPRSCSAKACSGVSRSSSARTR